MRYHGNYCGPNWSAGKHQASVDSNVPASDEFDESCKMHDRAYALGLPLKAADMQFARDNLLSLSPKRMLAGALVGAQGLFRPDDRPILPTTMNNTISKRGNQTRFSNPSPIMRRSAPGGNQNTTRVGNDITRMAPVATATRRTGQAAVIRSTGKGVTVTHRTFLGPITNTLAYTVTGFNVNPGLADTFPWLSKVASRYDKYRFTKLRFEFRSVAATSTPGVCMMSFDYNAADPLPVNKQIQAQTIPNAENNIWVNNDLVVPVDQQWRFVRQSLVAGTDIKTYDMGVMSLSTVYGGGSVGGELYVEYTVELEKPSEPDAIASLGTATGPLVAGPLFSGSVPMAFTGLPSWRAISSTALECVVPGTWVFTQETTGASITFAIQPSLLIGTPVVTNLFAPVVNTAATRALTTYTVRAQKGDRISYSGTISAATVTFFTLAISEWTTS